MDACSVLCGGPCAWLWACAGAVASCEPRRAARRDAGAIIPTGPTTTAWSVAITSLCSIRLGDFRSWTSVGNASTKGRRSTRVHWPCPWRPARIRLEAKPFDQAHRQAVDDERRGDARPRVRRRQTFGVPSGSRLWAIRSASGWGVDDGDGFEPLLESRLSTRSRGQRRARVEILNFAVPDMPRGSVGALPRGRRRAVGSTWSSTRPLSPIRVGTNAGSEAFSTGASQRPQGAAIRSELSQAGRSRERARGI